MDRRKFLKGIGIGVATLTVAPQILSNDTISGHPGVNGAPFKVQLGAQPPFVKSAIYYSPLRGHQYYASSEETLIPITPDAGLYILLSREPYPKDLQLVGSVHSEF